MPLKHMDCWNCQYVGSVPGSCHACCEHPTVKKEIKNKNVLLMVLRYGVANVFYTAMYIMEIRLHPHGVRKGWANWPLEYDPIWVLNCNSFQAKEDKQDG